MIEKVKVFTKFPLYLLRPEISDESQLKGQDEYGAISIQYYDQNGNAQKEVLFGFGDNLRSQDKREAQALVEYLLGYITDIIKIEEKEEKEQGRGKL